MEFNLFIIIINVKCNLIRLPPDMLKTIHFPSLMARRLLHVSREHDIMTQHE